MGSERRFELGNIVNRASDLICPPYSQSRERDGKVMLSSLAGFSAGLTLSVAAMGLARTIYPEIPGIINFGVNYTFFTVAGYSMGYRLGVHFTGG